MRLSQFLVELTLDISDEDAKDPNKVAKLSRDMARKVERNPDAVHRQNRVSARAERQVASASESPTKSLDMEIARTKEKLAMLIQRRARMSKT